jgi:hypothetical protein
MKDFIHTISHFFGWNKVRVYRFRTSEYDQLSCFECVDCGQLQDFWVSEHS